MTRITAKTIRTQVPRITAKSQETIMGGAAPALGNLIWNGLEGKTECEWAHRSAYSFGDLLQPQRGAQINRNLVLGTKSANSLMCRYEASIRRFVKIGDSAVMLTTNIPKHPQDIDKKSATLEAFGILEDDDKSFDKAMAKNYTWFCPLLQYNVECTSSTNHRAQGAGGMRGIPMFRLRKVLTWETTLNKIVEDSVFQGTTVGEAAGVPVKPNPFPKDWMGTGGKEMTKQEMSEFIRKFEEDVDND